MRITYSSDTTPPAITIDAPAQDATYNEAEAVDASYSCSDDGVGVASCAGPVPAGEPLDTSTPGTHTFTVTATDNTANQSTQTVTYNVQAPVTPPVTFITPNPPNSPNPPASPNPSVGQSSPATPGTPTTPATPLPPAQGHPPNSLLAFVNTESPTISGPRLVGRVLIASPGTWSGNARLHYQWKRCSAAGARCRDVMHATGRTYRLTSADIGHKVTVTVSAIDTHGHRASATPRAVGPIDRPSRRRGSR